MIQSNPKARAFDFYFGQALGALLQVYSAPDAKAEKPELTDYERQVFDAIVARAEYVAGRAMATRGKFVGLPDPTRNLDEDRQEFMRTDR